MLHTTEPSGKIHASPMSEPRLQILLATETGTRWVDVNRSPFTIGRGSENDLRLVDAQVSRQHSELVQKHGVWYIVDRKSRLGTFLNSERVQTALVQPGDRLRVGATELRMGTSDERPYSDTTASFNFRQVNALLKGLQGLGSSAVLEEVLALVLDSALELSGAERGFILLADESGSLKPRLARQRGGTTVTGAKTSWRIPEEVFATGEDRIVTDLRDEAWSGEHAGTLALGIRHVLCTPLHMIQYGGEAVPTRIGVLYLDSRERGYLEHTAALHLLAAEASVVIENARLYREVVQKEREAQALRIAASIQRALLPPRHYESPRVELEADSVPCLAVGGDLFEYTPSNDDGFAFMVADVAGKGTAAAILAAVVQGLLAAEGGTGDSPDVVLTRVNRALCRRTIDARFVTAFYGRLADNGRLQYCNAGHNPPLLLSTSAVRTLEATGYPLGLFDTATYELGETAIGTDDLLVLYSDGVTEATNDADEEYGDARLRACLEPLRRAPVADVLQAVRDSVKAFTGDVPPQDDVTVMVLRTC